MKDQFFYENLRDDYTARDELFMAILTDDYIKNKNKREAIKKNNGNLPKINKNRSISSRIWT